MFEAKIVAHSVSEFGKEIITYQLKYPRFIHAEFMTHRVLSRNASSSRAIPVAKMIEQVRTNPAMPIHWGANQPGMQAKEELTGSDLVATQDDWLVAAKTAAAIAERMDSYGAHKQIVNRILEPFQWISVVCTATEWDNFHTLRSHADAQPEIKLLSDLMLEARKASEPRLLKEGMWHLPYADTHADWVGAFNHLKNGRITRDEPKSSEVLSLLSRVSAARCARVSYLTHEGKTSTIDQDLALCERLAGAQPFHASPFEHQATPDTKVYPEWDLEKLCEDYELLWAYPELHGNLVGWVQHRKTMVGENITSFNY